MGKRQGRGGESADHDRDGGGGERVREGVPDRLDRRHQEHTAVGRGERLVVGEPEAVRPLEGPLDQHAERQKDQHRDRGDHSGEQRPLARAARAPGGVRRVDEAQRALQPAHAPGVHREDDPHGGELHDREDGRRGEVEDLRGLPVDLHLERGERRPAEDLDHAERREREEEDHQRGGRDGGPERGQRHLPPGRPAGGAQHPGGLLLPGVELRPQPADGAHDDGVVEEDVGEQDRPHRGVEADAPQTVEQPGAADQRQERRADDDGRQHERHGDGGPQNLLAPELEAREDVRAGERDQQREHGRGERLPGREPQDVPDVGLPEHVGCPPELPVAARLQAAGDDRRDRIGEEDREERDGHGHQAEPRRAPAPTTLTGLRRALPGA